MRFVADRSWAERGRQRHRPEHGTVRRRFGIEVDDRDEVGRLVRLIAGPDQQGRLGILAVVRGDPRGVRSRSDEDETDDEYREYDEAEWPSSLGCHRSHQCQIRW